MCFLFLQGLLVHLILLMKLFIHIRTHQSFGIKWAMLSLNKLSLRAPIGYTKTKVSRISFSCFVAVSFTFINCVKAGVHEKAVLTSLSTAVLSIPWSRLAVLYKFLGDFWAFWERYIYSERIG